MLKTKQNQDGVAHLLVIVLFIATIGVIGFVGYTVAGKNKNNTKPQAASVAINEAVQDSCNKDLNDKDLCKFAAKFNLDKVAYKTVVTSTDADGSYTTVMEQDGMGNNSVVALKDGKEAAAFIKLDSKSYVKNLSDGSWLEVSAQSATESEESAPGGAIRIDTKDFSYKDIVTHKKIGKETCGKLKCFKYEIADSKTPTLKQLIWFDDEDYLMQRYASKTDIGSYDMTFDYRAVNVQVPSPIKKFPTSTN